MDHEKRSFEQSRSSSWTDATSGRPDLYRRNSLASLSVARDPTQPLEEQRLPRVWKPYTSVLGGFLLLFNSWGLVNTYGTYASYYRQHLLPGRDIELVNLVGSTQSFVILILSTVVGRFLDAGHIRELLIAGTLLVSPGSFLLSIVNRQGRCNEGNYSLIWLTQGLVSGFGMACFFVSSPQVVTTWFKAKKGLAIGVVVSDASIAGLVYPMMAKFLLVDVGFNDSTRYVATVITLTSALAIFIARANPNHRLRKQKTWIDFRVFIDFQAYRYAPFAWLTASIIRLLFSALQS